MVEAVKNVAGEQSDGCEDSFTHPANECPEVRSAHKELCDIKETFAWMSEDPGSRKKAEDSRILSDLCAKIGQKTYPLSHWKQ